VSKADIRDWATPTTLGAAVGETPAMENVAPQPAPIFDVKTEIPQPESTSESTSSPLDFLNNPAIGLALNLIKGEKLDVMTLLPLIMQMTAKKPEPKSNDKTLSLDNYTVIS